MQIATIVPTPYLRYTAQDDYHMCVYQEVVKQPKYAEFFKEMAEDPSKYVIMDNGAAEEVNPTAYELMKAYEIVKPQEIVLPDMVGDKEITLHRTREAFRIFTDKHLSSEYRYMMVPQGETFTEWCDCLDEMLMLRPYSVGVSKFMTKILQEELGDGTNVRLELVDMILQRCKVLDVKVKIHLLGCYNHPREIGEIIKVFPVVRGVDSAVAYIYAQEGISLKSEKNRPSSKMKFDKISKDHRQLFLNNKMEYEQYCLGRY